MSFLQKILRLPHIDKASGYNIRARKQLVGMLLQCEDNDDDTILGKVLAVAENNVSDISNTESVNENAAGLYMIDHICAALTDLEHISCVEHHNILLRDSKILRNVLLGCQMTVLAMYRDCMMDTLLRCHLFPDTADYGASYGFVNKGRGKKLVQAMVVRLQERWPL